MQAPTPNDDAEKLLSAGIDALKAGDSARARDLLGQAIRRNPRDERAWLWLSGAMNTDDERRQCLQRVLQINPNNAAARSGLATLSAAATAPAAATTPAAASAAPPATPSGPQPPPLHTAENPTSTTPSIASLRAVSTPRRVNPQLVAVIAATCVVVALGAILLMRRFGGSASAIQPTAVPAIALAAPEPPPATKQPTPTPARPTQAATAMPTMTPSPTAAPTSTPTAAGKLILQGLAKAQAKDYRGAIALYSEALKREPQNAEAFFQRGQARDGLGDPRSAIKNYSQVLQIDPNHSAAYSARGDARLKLKDIPGALEDYQRAAELYTSAGDTEHANAIAEKIKALQ